MPWIDFTREFDAPVEAVFGAHRDPELVRQWLGPRGYEMDIERWDFTHRRRLPLRAPQPRRRRVTASTACSTRSATTTSPIQTFEFEGAPDEVAIEFMRFVDLGDGRCRLRAAASAAPSRAAT